MANNRPAQIHLVPRPHVRPLLAACGLPNPRRYTTSEPARVTCTPCTKSLPMAITELASRQQAKQ